MSVTDQFKKRTRVAEFVYNRYLTVLTRDARPLYTPLIAAGQVSDSDIEALERERFVFQMSIWFVLICEYLGPYDEQLRLEVSGEFAIGIQLALEKIGKASRSDSADAVDIATGIGLIVLLSRQPSADAPTETDSASALAHLFVKRVLGRQSAASRAQWVSLLERFAKDEFAHARREFASLTLERAFHLP